MHSYIAQETVTSTSIIFLLYQDGFSFIYTNFTSK